MPSEFGRFVNVLNTEIQLADQLTDTGKPLHWIGFAKRTTNRLP